LLPLGFWWARGPRGTSALDTESEAQVQQSGLALFQFNLNTLLYILYMFDIYFFLIGDIYANADSVILSKICSTFVY